MNKRESTTVQKVIIKINELLLFYFVILFYLLLRSES